MDPKVSKNTEDPAQFPNGLAQDLINYSCDVPNAKTPKEVLNGLHAVTSKRLHLNVYVAIRFPDRPTDWDALELGKTVFLHEFDAKGLMGGMDQAGPSQAASRLYAGTDEPRPAHRN